MTLRERFGLNFQDLRREHGFSQESFANETGIDRGYISDLDNAKFAASLDMVERIADGLGVDPSVLLKPR